MTEILTVPDDHTPVDKLIFRRLRKEVPGLVEATLDANPGLAALGDFPPAGTTVTFDAPVPSKKLIVRKTVKLYG